MFFNINHISSEPLHIQIKNQIKMKIVEGMLKPGEETETVGTFARKQKVNRRSVIKAYGELKNENLFIEENDLLKIKKLTNAEIAELKSELNRKETEEFEKERIDVELRAAQQIQTDLLPKNLPNNDRFALAAYSSVAKTMGGDFYDYLPMNEDQFGLVIGDASGKGMPGALLISQIQAILKSSFKNANSLRNTLKILNEYLLKNTAAKNFVTLFYGFLDSYTGRFHYCNAGHNFPFVVRKNGQIEELDKKNPALGIIKNAEYLENSIYLNEGDMIFFYTDGITEALNEKKEFFGLKRLKSLISENSNLDSENLIDSINYEVELFQGNMNETDDKTVMILKRKADRCS